MNQKKEHFNETLAIMDDQTWIWNFVSSRFNRLEINHVRLPSDVPLRQSWERLKDAARMVIHWETKQRSGGAIVEEILDIEPNFQVGERIIIVTTNPTHEDVVYFSELGLRRIIKLRNRDKDLVESSKELDHYLQAKLITDKVEAAWHELLNTLDTQPEKPSASMLQQLQNRLEALEPEMPTARYLDACGQLFILRGSEQRALRSWLAALDKNPNYLRTYNNLIQFHRKKGELTEALALMQKMQELNHGNISRLVSMGEIKMELKDLEKAEFYFNSALERDNQCSRALNGLAEIRFHNGDLEESRRLLARSHLAFKAAQKFNRQGIELVKLQKFEEALDHYTKAQYVLPQQDKGPLLFYNIALCYARWGKKKMAREFLKIALIKEPTYKKANKLLAEIEQHLEIDADEVA